MSEDRAGGAREPFAVQRLGVIMRPDPSRPQESEGVLNPAVARGRAGQLYLFPRTVGRGNYSRIGIARVLVDARGRPAGVERIGYAVEPSEPYELRPGDGTGGCEDPRITYVEPLDRYVMAYAAWGPEDSRVALAVSDDLISWRKLGPVRFQPAPGADMDLNTYPNKDAAVFPGAVTAPDGRAALAVMHRPMYDAATRPRGVADARPAIWLSYCPLDEAQHDVAALTALRMHHLLALPERHWERSYIGGGTPPLRTPRGWLLVYHGVAPAAGKTGDHETPRYAAGAMLLDEADPRRVLYHSPAPILAPQTPDEGTIVFPTGVDPRDDGTIDVYYGMANARIGAGRLTLPRQGP